MLLLSHVACEIGARCNTVAMVTGMQEQRLFHPKSALEGSIVTQQGKFDANTRVCCVWYAACVYEIWSSELEFSFVIHLGKIHVAGVWGMEYGVWSMGYVNLYLTHSF